MYVGTVDGLLTEDDEGTPMLFLFHTDTEEGQHILAHAPGASASCLDKRTQRSGQGTHGGRIVGSRGGNWRRALAALVALPGHSSPWLVADFLVLRAVLPLDRLPGPQIWVVIRRKVSGEASEPEWKFYVSNAPIETPLSTFVRVSGMRWPIETCFAECKGELGMDHYELRFWRGWHHHMTLVILAHHFLVRWQQKLALREGALAPHDDAPLAHAQ
jgi:hypothetical protein